ncbi:MAG: hypothetical protein KDE27_07195 [Planctomycetes bacterium]|nr:hypothetical protein [Planctomycetota bacterium]
MRFWPRSVLRRVLATLAFAIALIVGLDFAVKRVDAEQRPTGRRRLLAAAPALPPPVRLATVAGSVLLATSFANVPAEAAPVVQVFDDGGYALHRPSPLPVAPGPVPGSAAILLPGTALLRIDSRARATFAEIVGALVAERPVAPERFVTIGFELEREQLARVLNWVR